MRKPTLRALQFVLIGIVLLSLLLAGCGGKPAAQSGEPGQATQGNQAGTGEEKEEPTATPEQQEEATPAEESSTEVENALDNALKLAPLHITTSYLSKKGDAVRSQVGLEADLDAKGNQHLLLTDQGGQVTEIYLVDGKMYLKSADMEQFIAMPSDIGKDSTFAFVAIYGGAFLLGYNDLKDARKVGSENVNGFQCDKYEIKYDLASLGLTGLAAGTTGAQWDYKGYAWIETRNMALVRAQVDWLSKGAEETEAESFHSEYEAKPGTVTEVKPPENVLEIPQQ